MNSQLVDCTSTFDEPRGWALAWEGTALTEAQGRASSNGRDQLVKTEGWARQWTTFVQLEQPVSQNGNGMSSFGSPKSWALAWDSFALEGTD
jgi:hypothetical protein